MNWDPTDWEEWVNSLLDARYGARYQRIPAGDQGDLGIEGFATDGTVYQCYAPQNSDDADDLYEKQRSKIYRDTGKLRTYEAGLTKALCGIKVSIWILVVPRFETKRLVLYAAERTTEVRSWNLGFIDPDFRIHVQTDEDYPSERRMLMEPVDLSGRLRALVVADSAARPKAELVGVMDTKVRVLGLPERKHSALMQALVEHFVRGQQMLDYLRLRWPDRFEALQAAKRTRQISLALEAVGADPNSRLMFAELRRSLIETYAAVAGTQSDVAEPLADESIADWLMRCPLEF